MVLCCLVWISTRRLACILLYHGIHPTPELPLSILGDLVAQWLYYTMAMGTVSFVGLFKAAVDTARTWGVWQRYLGRLEHDLNRPEDYDYLLALCRSEIPRSEASDLLVP